MIQYECPVCGSRISASEGIRSVYCSVSNGTSVGADKFAHYTRMTPVETAGAE
jgi:hypothetical protein